jgi:hypothetical protein
MLKLNLTVACLTFAMVVMPDAAAAADKPIKVFILAGQSNMVGHGKTLNGLNPHYDPDQKQSRTNQREIHGGIGCLTWAVKAMPETFGPTGTDPLVDANGDWLVRDDVNVYIRMEVFEDKDNPGQLTKGITRKGPHTVGFGKANKPTQIWNGPEYGFGHIVGNALDEDVLIIKVATGGTSLKTRWRSPTAVAKRGGEVGYMWTHMLSTVDHVLKNLVTEFPEYAGRDYQIAGFGWHQGYNDRVDAEAAPQYEVNMADFIADVRKQFGEGLPFVIATTGMGMPEDQTSGAWDLVRAQTAMADFAKYPSHKGNVAVVDTVPMYRDGAESPSTMVHHWNHNGIAHYQIGAGMGKAYLGLVAQAKP